MDGQELADKVGQVAQDANTKVKETLGRAGESLAAAGQTAQTVADRARSAGVEAGAKLKQASDQGAETLRDLSQGGSEAWRYVREQATAHPMPALLIAAALGYGFARIINWR